MNLAKSRNEAHIGSDVNHVIEARRQKKEALRKQAAEKNKTKQANT